MSVAGDELRPFLIQIPQADLDDLRNQLARTRWAEDLPGMAGWDYGVPAGYVRELAGYWQTGYDWRAAEAKLNAFPQFTTVIDRQLVHFLHVRSAEPDAVPLLLTHGWPGTIVEYTGIIAEPTDPRSVGADPSLAFGGAGTVEETQRSEKQAREPGRHSGIFRVARHGGTIPAGHPPNGGCRTGGEQSKRGRCRG